MTAPLFTALDLCGCPTRAGHTCRPAWMTETEWALPVATHGKIRDTTEKRPPGQMFAHPIVPEGLTLTGGLQ